MQSTHDCESKFGSISETSFWATASTRAPSGVSWAAPTASASRSERTPGRGTGAPGREPTSAATQAQPDARTQPERSRLPLCSPLCLAFYPTFYGAQRRGAICSATGSGSSACGECGEPALAAAAKSDSPSVVQRAAAFACAGRDTTRSVVTAGSRAACHIARVRRATRVAPGASQTRRAVGCGLPRSGKSFHQARHACRATASSKPVRAAREPSRTTCSAQPIRAARESRRTTCSARPVRAAREPRRTT